MKWSDLAEWRGPTGNQGGPMVEVRGVVLHIAEGSFEGTISWQKNPTSDVSSHFVKGKVDGEEAQVVDTDVTAWTQRDGNGHWLSIENAGFVPDALTASQVEFAAQVLAKAHKVYGVPLQVTSDPDGRGLGHHSMGAPEWGHSQCPGQAIINQKSAIVARAKEIVEGNVTLSADDARKVSRTDGAVDNNMAWRSDSPQHDPPGDNETVQLQTAVLEAANEANRGADAAERAVELLSGVGVPVVLTDEQLAELRAGIAEDVIAGLRALQWVATPTP